MVRATVVGMVGFVGLTLLAIVAIVLRQQHDSLSQDDITDASEMSFLVCKRALPYVMGSSQGIKAERLSFRTISTNETGGYRILLCLKK